MRWVLDILAVLTAAGLIAAVVMFQRVQGQSEAQVERAATDLRRLELEIKYRSVTKNAELNEFGWPVTVDPKWFGEDLPRNMLVSTRGAWIEIAGPGEAKLLNPRVRLAVDDSIAGFWYNPAQGVIRARVPVMVSDQEAVDLYNRINGTALASAFEREVADVPKTEADGEGGGAGDDSGAAKGDKAPGTGGVAQAEGAAGSGSETGGGGKPSSTAKPGSK